MALSLNHHIAMTRSPHPREREGVCQEFCVNFLEIFVVFFHQRAKPFINEQLVPDYRPID